MASIDDVQGQLLAIDQYITSQMSTMHTHDRDESSIGLVRALKMSIATMPVLDLPDATSINTIINDMTHLHPNRKSELLSAIASKHLELSTGSNPNKQMQYFRAPCNFYTSDDWLVFDDPTKSKDMWWMEDPTREGTLIDLWREHDELYDPKAKQMLDRLDRPTLLKRFSTILKVPREFNYIYFIYQFL